MLVCDPGPSGPSSMTLARLLSFCHYLTKKMRMWLWIPSASPNNTAIQGAQPEILFYNTCKLQNHEQVFILRKVLQAEKVCKIAIPFSITWLMTWLCTRLIRTPSPAQQPVEWILLENHSGRRGEISWDSKFPRRDRDSSASWLVCSCNFHYFLWYERGGTRRNVLSKT
jgi:hypothetical protein